MEHCPAGASCLSLCNLCPSNAWNRNSLPSAPANIGLVLAVAACRGLLRKKAAFGYLPAARSMGKVYEIRSARCPRLLVSAVEAVCRGNGQAVVWDFVTWNEVLYAGVREQNWLSPELRSHNLSCNTISCGIRLHKQKQRHEKRAEAAVTIDV